MSTGPINEEVPPEDKAKVDRLVAELPFNEDIPRRSGELSFNHPWELRAFAITTAMHNDGNFNWSEFQRELISSIRRWEAGHAEVADWNYYDRWVDALERLLDEKGMLDPEELDRRTAEVFSAPPNVHHQHALREPVAIVRPAESEATDLG